MAVTGADPISAENLKAVVDQLKNELGGGVVLYDDESLPVKNNSNSHTVTLSKPKSEFRLIEFWIADYGESMGMASYGQTAVAYFEPRLLAASATGNIYAACTGNYSPIIRSSEDNVLYFSYDVNNAKVSRVIGYK